MEFENDSAKYKIFVGILLFFLLVFGIFVGLSVSYNSNVANDLNSYTPDDVKKDFSVGYDNNVEAVSTKTYDIELVYIDNYSLCGEKFETRDIIYSTNLEQLKNKESLKQLKENKKYVITEENNEKLVYERTLEQNCPNHFLVVLEDKKINIYNMLTDKIKESYQSIDISEELIRNELIEELTKGIVVNSIEELNLIIEDIES